MKQSYRVWILALVMLLLGSVRLGAQTPTPESPTTLGAVIKVIQSTSDYVFFYDDHLSNVLVVKGNLDVKLEPITSILDRTLNGTNVSYKIEEKLIYLSQPAPSRRENTPARTVKGQITDENGEPVIGAAVIQKGTMNASMTDFDGNYSLSIKDKNVTLVVAIMGYEQKEVAIAEHQSVVNISIKSETLMMEETVVVAYGSLRKELVTNSISSLKPTESMARTALSPSELLQGRIAGVNTSTSSGNLGTAERVSIRGSSSLSASNEPLYVVDGIPLNNEKGSLYSFGEDLSSLSVLNLTDIESIEVLKDAASAAIYGSRGTNGVILITTKSGKAGRSDIKINYNSGVSQFPYKDRIQYASSALWVDTYNDGIDNYNRQNNYDKGNSGYVEHIRNPFLGLPDTDWLGVITRLATQHNADVSFSYGNDKTKLYLGANYAYQEGVIKTNDITKINLKMNLSHKMNNWLEVGGNMSANYLANNRVPGANIGSTIVARATEQRPFDRPYKPNGGYYLGGTDELSRHNPVQILSEQRSYVNNYRYLGALWGQATIAKGLTAKVSYNTDAGYTLDYLYYNSKHPYKENNGRIIEKNRFLMTNLIESYVNYDHSWKDFSLNAMAGHSFQKTSSRQNSIDAQNYPSVSFNTVGVAGEIAGVTGGINEYAIESWYGRATFGYKDKYVANATLRADGSSRFAPAHRWGVFPSVSFGWNVSKEDFWKVKSSELKLRASYGKTGNQDGITNYGWQPLIGGGYTYAGESGIAVGSKGNENLTWETADQYDLGFDLSFFGGALNMMFDAYLKNTNNLLYQKPMYATSGQTSILSNIGSMQNKGIELSINSSVDIGKVQWNSSFNISHNSNKITRLTSDDDFVSIGSNHVLQVGKEIGAFYLLQFDGIYQYDGQVPDGEYGIGVRAGDIRYYDKDNNGVINDDDKIVVGSPNPLFSGGWNNSFTYKNLTLDVFFTYSYGADVYAAWMTGPTRMGNYQGLLKEWAENRWTGPGSTNYYSRSIYSYHGNNSRASTYLLKDGSFIKLKSVMLSYVLPKIWKNVKTIRVYVQGENLALLSKYPGWDPEISTSMDPSLIGIDNYGMPAPTIYKMGLNLTF